MTVWWNYDVAAGKVTVTSSAERAELIITRDNVGDTHGGTFIHVNWDTYTLHVGDDTADIAANNRGNLTTGLSN